jgi:hypothetical protein
MIISEAQFLREFAIRQSIPFIFFLGAGASRTSGIPTANEMTWIFKRDLYCSSNNISPEACKDITNPVIQRRITDWLESQPTHRNIKWEDEYSHYFETAYPTKDRRKDFIDLYVRRANPSIGYKCLGALINAKKVRDIFTTNFDTLVEMVHPNIFVVSDESADRIQKLRMVDESPKLIKLHGDFRYDHLRNTSSELRKLNTLIEEKIKLFLKEFGLLVIGYSGKDESIMKLLEQTAFNNHNSFPAGFYWCIRKGEHIYKRVESLVDYIKGNGREAGFIEITSFDDFMVKLYRYCKVNDQQIESELSQIKKRKEPFFYEPKKSGSRPHIKTNWIRIEEYPTSVYSFKTNLTEWHQLDKLTKNQLVLASFAYPKSIIAIGNRATIENIFKDYIIEPIQIRSITTEDIAKINRDHGFVYCLFYNFFDCFFEEGLKLSRLKRRCYWNKTKSTKFDSRWIKDFSCFIHPAFNYKLEQRDNQLFLLIQPTVVLTSNRMNLVKDNIKFIIINEILSSWYNRIWDKKLNEWLKEILSKSNGIIGFPPSLDPPNAKFKISNHFYYSAPRS